MPLEPTSDGLVAAGAEGPPLRVVVRLAVREALVVEERAPVERLLAVLWEHTSFS